MSKIGQYIIENEIYQEFPDDEPNLYDDPGYRAWSEALDEEDIKIQDQEPF